MAAMDEEVKEVCEFLKSNKIEDHILERFKNEKMCFEAVQMSTETDLRQLGLAKGDIIKVKHFCANRSKEQKSKENLKEKKELLEAILESNKSKRKFHTTKEKLPASKRSKANSGVSRRVQVGWLHYNAQTKCFNVVRQGQGGGPRNLNFPLDATKDNVIEAAKPYYFPGGCSKKHGIADNMIFSLANFEKEEMSDVLNVNGEETPFTVGAYAEATKLPLLKVFLTTRLREKKAHGDEKEVHVDDSTDDDDDTPLMYSIFDPKPKVKKDLLKPDMMEWKKSLKDQNNHTKDDASTSSLKEDVINVDSDGDISDFDVKTSSKHSKPKFDITKTRELKVQQDAAYNASLKKDQEKLRKANEHSVQIQEQEKMQQKRLLRVPVEPEEKEDSVLIQVRHLTLGIVRRNFSKSCKVSSVYDWVGSKSPVPMHFTLSDHRGKECLPDQPVLDVQRCTLNMTESESTPTLQDGDEVNFKGFGDNKDDNDDTIFNDTSNNDGFEIGVVSEHLPQELFQQDDSSDHEDIEQRVLDQPSDYAPGREFRRRINELYHTDSDYDELLTGVKRIEVPRADILPFMLNLYEDENICQSSLAVKFKNELGSDLGGVTRDVFSCFWDKAYDAYFIGDTVKIPFVPPHKMSEAQPVFRKLGRIFSHGYLLTKTIPVRFCQVFVSAVLFGEEAISDDQLIPCFLNCITPWEKELFLRGLKGALTVQDEDDVISALSRFGMRCQPSKDAGRFKAQVMDLAKSELLYKPSMLLHWMRQGIPSDHFDRVWSKFSREKFAEFYESLMPTTENVASAITSDIPDLTDEQDRVLHFLKCFVRSLDQDNLERFLHFVTGTSVSPRGAIKVAFNSSIGLARAPSASTCGSVISLSTNYDSFHEFKCEFLKVLQSEEAFEMSNV